MFIIIPMYLFLKSFNGEDRKICASFLPEITDTGHQLHKKYQNLKNDLFSISKKLIAKKSKVFGKENQNWNKSSVYQGRFKSLLNSAKFLSMNTSAVKQNKIEKQLYNLSNLANQIIL